MRFRWERKVNRETFVSTVLPSRTYPPYVGDRVKLTDKYIRFKHGDSQDYKAVRDMRGIIIGLDEGLLEVEWDNPARFDENRFGTRPNEQHWSIYKKISLYGQDVLQHE